MRYVRIFLLNFQYVFERRGRSFVWFLVSFINPLILLFYWRGALQTNSIKGWSLSSVSSYYFLLIVAAAMLMSHIEEDVSDEDINDGQLVKYIIKPFSYFWYNFIREVPYRLLQGSFGIVSCFIFFLLFGSFFQLTSSFYILSLSVIVFVLAYILSFTYKMVLGIMAFWLIDARGFYQLVEVLTIVFAGYILPLELMPSSLESISKILPFAYMIYYPVIVLQGKMPANFIIQIIIAQVMWIGIFGLLYKILWFRGIRKFTGVGQ